jgi:lipopolysaccharide heptosyltransferase II
MRTRLITILVRALGLWFRRRPAPPIPAAPRSVLIIKPCCLGDVLLTTPLVAALRERWPESRITYATGAWSLPMVATSHHIDATITLPDHWTPGSLLATARELRRHTFEIVFVPERSPVFTLLAWLARIPVRVGLDSLGRGFAHTHPVPLPPGVTHEADLYSRLATHIGLDPPRRLFFFPDESSRESAAALVSQHRADNRPLVAIHPGGGQNPGMTLPRKRWFADRWAAVADALSRRHGAQVIIVGGPGDEEPAQAVADAMHESSIALVRRWNWGELAALIERCDLFLGHDTGMMHLAVAVDTPVVAVFGPSDPQVYGPYGERGAYIWRPTPESPCFYDGAAVPDCPCAMRCMHNVEADGVIAAAEQLLRLAQTKDS